DGIADSSNDDRDRARRVRGGQCGSSPPGREDDVHLTLHEVRRESRESLEFVLRVPVLEDDRAPLDVPELAQRAAKRVHGAPLTGDLTQDADPGRVAGGLRLGDERRGEEREREGDEEPESQALLACRRATAAEAEGGRIPPGLRPVLDRKR